MKNRKRADLVVFGRIFTAEDSQLAEAFAVKDGRFIYVGGRKGAEAFIEEGKTEVLDYTGQGLVMPSCGNGHAHYFTGHAMPMVGAVVEAKGDVNKFLTETVPDAVKKAKANGINTVFGFGWDYHLIHDRLPTRQQLDAIQAAHGQHRVLLILQLRILLGLRPPAAHSQLAPQYLNQKIPVAARGFQKAAVYPLRLRLHQVEHGVHLTRMGEHLAVVHHPLARFNLPPRQWGSGCICHSLHWVCACAYLCGLRVGG